MKYTYPVIFEPAEEGGFIVSVPDVSGCFTDGETMTEAMEMAKDALEMMLVHYEDNKMPIPPASDIKSIKTDFIVSYVLADTDEWRKQFDNRAVKKNCTIPAWLNYKAEKASINFSQVLQDALKKILGVSEPSSAAIA
ncbi:MAG: type II toxin-antitoxin system HicB family antitoxin [Treponema sp.]|nr:type II toxin-antitoxin system HicB family antitoxin [Treponema sp.]MBR3548839.1 type II toxin-antitoxin system HicB family antitoxin [Treponema sp.]